MKTYLILTLTFIGLIGNAWAGLNDGLIANYPFNGNADDESGNSINGLVYSATLTTDRFGNPNSAYEFDGIDDYIDFGNVELNIGNDFCLSTWIKAKANRYSHRVVFSKGSKNAGHFEIYLDVEIPGVTIAGEFRFYPYEHTYGSGISVDDNSFHHLIVNSKDNSISFYIDGVLHNTHTFSEIIPDENEIFFIGRQTENYYNPNHAPMYFTGIIDDIRIYNRALSEDEIQELYTMSDGNNTCSEEVLDEAYNQGYDNGYATGYNEGQETGYSTGYTDGYSAGEQAGYNAGIISTDKVTICHTNGKSSNVMIIPRKALATHLRHGDTIGSCRK